MRGSTVPRNALQLFPIIMTFELFLSGRVMAALLRVSFLGTYGGRAMIVIFCHNFCFADSIS